MSYTTTTTQETRSSPITAALETISYASLAQSKPETLNTLWRAVVDQGFFYLKLDNSVAEDLALDVETLFATSRDLFRLPMEEKMQYDTKILAKERNYG